MKQATTDGKLIAWINHFSQEQIEKGLYGVFLFFAIWTPLKLPIVYFCFYDFAMITYLIQNVLYVFTTFWVLIWIFQRVFCMNRTSIPLIKKKLFHDNLWMFFLLLFWIWMIVCTLCAKNPYLAIVGSVRRSQGITARTMYLVLLFGFLLFRSKEKLTRIVQVFALSATIQSILGLIGYAFQLFADGKPLRLYTTSGVYFRGVFDYFNHFGYFQCMVILAIMGLLMFCKNKWLSILYSVCLILDVWILILNHTFGGLLAACVAGIILFILCCIYHRQIRAQYIIPSVLFWVTCIAASAISPECSVWTEFRQLYSDASYIIEDSELAYSAGTGRWELWNTAIGFIKKSPLVGYGEDGLAVLYEKAGYLQDKPANEYIEYAGYFGIPGILFYLLALFTLLVTKWKRLRSLSDIQIIVGGMVIAYAGSATFGNSVYYTTVYFFLFLGVIGNHHIEKSLNVTKSNLSHDLRLLFYFIHKKTDKHIACRS